MCVIESYNLLIEIKLDLSFCSTCKLGKKHTLPFQVSAFYYTKPLELVHSDLWGLASISSLSGHLYYIMFVDDFS